MGKQLISLILIFNLMSISAQERPVFDGIPTSPDFIILIDGKIPLALSIEMSWGEITERQTLFYHVYYNSNILLSNDLSVLNTISDTTTIQMDIIFEEALDYLSEVKHTYSVCVKWGLLKRTKIITVTNLNKNKTKYYIHCIYEPPLKEEVIWKKEYGNRRRFEKKVFKGIYPLSYYRSSNKGKSRPIY